MDFHELIHERYSVIAAGSGLQYFRVAPLPEPAKKALFLPQDEVIQNRHTKNGEQATPELIDPKKKGMVLYSLGDYHKGPKRFFVVQMDDKGMWWIKPGTSQTNWTAHGHESLEYTGFLPWHKELIMHPKLMTVDQFHKIKKVSELAPEQDHDTDTAKNIAAALKLHGYKPTIGKKQLHEIPILISGKDFTADNKSAHLQFLLREDEKSSTLTGNLQHSYAQFTDGRKVQKGDEQWYPGKEKIDFKDFDAGINQLLNQIKKYE